MALPGFGVGDIIAITKFIVDTIQDIKDALPELQDVAEQVELVKETLQSIDEELPQDVVPGNRHSIKRRKERVKVVLNNMLAILIKYRDNQGRVKTFGQVKYALWDKREMADLVAKLRTRTDDLTTFLLMQIWHLTHQMRPLIGQVLTVARQKQDRADKKSSVRHTDAARHSNSNIDHITASDEIGRVQAVLDRILQTEQPGNPTTQSDQEDVPIEQELETQLGQAGIGVTFTKALIEVVHQQRKRLLHPEDIDPTSYTGGKNLLGMSKGWILVIDSQNGVRSIIAQSYLELVRVWTVNNSGEWLFNRVESAGVRVETKFSRRCLESRPELLMKGGRAPDTDALEAFPGKKSYFRSKESDDILARIAQHRSRGLDNSQFRKYEYMLCFDKSVYETVTYLAECCKKEYGHMPSYATLSKVILLPDVRLKSAMAKLSVDDKRRLVNSIKDSIEGFLEKEYHWKRPPLSITEGPFRTKQISLPNLDINLSPAEKEAKLSDISAKTECRIRITDEKMDAQLFSITGRKEALSFASSLIREAFSKPQILK